MNLNLDESRSATEFITNVNKHKFQARPEAIGVRIWCVLDQTAAAFGSPRERWPLMAVCNGKPAVSFAGFIFPVTHPLPPSETRLFTGLASARKRCCLLPSRAAPSSLLAQSSKYGYIQASRQQPEPFLSASVRQLATTGV